MHQQLFIKVYGYIFMFLTSFTKGSNFSDFLYAFLENMALLKLGLPYLP